MSDDKQVPVVDRAAGPRLRARRLLLVPLAAFAVLASVFGFALRKGDPNRLPSALIGKPVPAFVLPGVDGLQAGDAPGAVPGFAATDLAIGKPVIVNVWASWCTPCVAEHPFLMDLGRLSGAPIFGLNYKDKPEAARRFLGRHGNPYVAVGADATGRTAIDWGVYGVPETFIVNGRGEIAYKHVGPITPEALERELLPLLRKLQ